MQVVVCGVTHIYFTVALVIFDSYHRIGKEDFNRRECTAKPSKMYVHGYEDQSALLKKHVYNRHKRTSVIDAFC